MFPLGTSLSYMLTKWISTKENLLYFTIVVDLVKHGFKNFEDIILTVFKITASDQHLLVKCVKLPDILL